MPWNEISCIDVAENSAELSERAFVTLTRKTTHTKQRLVHIGALKRNALHRSRVLRHRVASSLSRVKQTVTVRNLVFKTWSKLGDGFCFAGGEQQEKEYMLTDWTIKTLESAKEACEADLACVGIHYDQWAQSKPDEGDYVLLNRLGTPNNNMAVRRSCYKLRENPELPGMYS